MEILFVDDEQRRMDVFAKELILSGYKVEYYQNVDSAWAFFEQHADEIKILILDIMMPPGQLLIDEEKEKGLIGLRTGIFFFERIRKKRLDLPVIIFTNVSDDEVEDRFRAELHCRFLQKKHYTPREFVQEIKSIMAESHQEQE